MSESNVLSGPLVPDDLILDRYRVQRRIGGGGFSVVYQGEDERLSRPVCVKVFHRVRTDDGTWRQLRVPTVNLPDKTDDPHFDIVLIGEGGYDGLIFIAQATWIGVCPQACSGFEVHGYIIDAERS